MTKFIKVKTINQRNEEIKSAFNDFIDPLLKVIEKISIWLVKKINYENR